MLHTSQRSLPCAVHPRGWGAAQRALTSIWVVIWVVNLPHSLRAASPSAHARSASLCVMGACGRRRCALLRAMLRAAQCCAHAPWQLAHARLSLPAILHAAHAVGALLESSAQFASKALIGDEVGWVARRWSWGCGRLFRCAWPCRRVDHQRLVSGLHWLHGLAAAMLPC